MTYLVKRIHRTVEINSVWDKNPWKQIEPVQLNFFMGEKPNHFPVTQAKLAYDNSALYVIFKVQDRYIRAVAKKHQDEVCNDSCVEFFFTPENSIQNGYFNLEMNCGGIMLFRYQTKSGIEMKDIDSAYLNQIELSHSMPESVNPELTTPVDWTVEYRLPFSILEKYYAMDQPNTNVIWRVNFYKCADKTSHPHWLTWAKVNFQNPNFHLPEFFGFVKFE